MEKNINKKNEKNIIQCQIKEYSCQIEKLLDALGKSRNGTTTELILKRIDEVTDIKNKLQEQYHKEQKNSTASTGSFPYEMYASSLLELRQDTWGLIKPDRQKDILKMVIKEITWNGKDAIIYLKCSQ